MKKILTILGAIFICFIVVGVIAISGIYYYHSGLNKESKAYVDEVLPMIVTSWNSKELINRASPEFLQVFTAEKIEMLFSTLSEQLGPLKEYKGLMGKAKVIITPKGKVIVANYLAKAVFEKAPAKIEIQTILSDHKWKIEGFRVTIDADVLYKEKIQRPIYQFE